MMTRLLTGTLLLGGAVWAQAPAPATRDLQLRGDRFPPLPYEQLNAEQKAMVEVVLQGKLPTLAGPYNMWLRSPDLGTAAHQFGAYPRFRSTVNTRLNELGIMMAASFWNSEFVWFAHRRAAQGAGLKPAIGDAIAAGKRPPEMDADEEAVYNFCDELLNKKQVSDAAFHALKAKLGEQGVVDLMAAVGYFQYVSMMLNVDRYPLPANVKPELK